MRGIAAAAALVLAFAADASAQASRTRSDALFEPWRAAAPRSGTFSFDSASGPRRRSDRNPSPSASLGGGLEQPDIGPHLADNLQRRVVAYSTGEATGTIIIDTANTHLYLVLGNGQALRYGIGVGREGFTWAGRERVTRM